MGVPISPYAKAVAHLSFVAKLFDRDPETNEVLWFAAPPVDLVHQPGPSYSMEYLHFLARKRKAAADAMDVEGPPKKERRREPTMTERLNAILANIDLPEKPPSSSS